MFKVFQESDNIPQHLSLVIESWFRRFFIYRVCRLLPVQRGVALSTWTSLCPHLCISPGASKSSGTGNFSFGSAARWQGKSTWSARQGIRFSRRPPCFKSRLCTCWLCDSLWLHFLGNKMKTTVLTSKSYYKA